jgi:alkanesulfonate monooxygenase SsuD/methylene tetrahydromethanopterin reductase-like flavin-dependent oxidoreductase (luciferase family)
MVTTGRLVHLPPPTTPEGIPGMSTPREQAPRFRGAPGGALQFGLSLLTAEQPGRDPVAEGRRAEELGFDFVSASDHPCGANPTYETWTMLSWVAAATSRIRVGTRVLGVPYRPPAIVAKMAETFDRLSGGRLILGLGGGYSDEEFRAFGLRVPTPAEKVTGLEEAIRITRGLWSEPAFSFAGGLFHTEAADLSPKPAHAIPIWLGTFGPRALALTGRLADGWIPSLGVAPPESVPAMRERIAAGARDAGRDPAAITCVYHLEVRVDEHPDPRPSVVAGPAEVVAERLAGFAALGFTAFSLSPFGPDLPEQVERLATEVLPAVRALVG